MGLPGLGRWRLGRRADGIARMAMFLRDFGALIVLVLARMGTGGLGSTLPLFVLFLLASVGIYATSAADASRIAAGDPPIVGSRALLWASAGLVLLSVVIATSITFPSTRR